MYSRNMDYVTVGYMVINLFQEKLRICRLA